MIGGVTCHMLPHLPGVPHLHVNRAQVWSEESWRSRRIRWDRISLIRTILQIIQRPNAIIVLSYIYPNKSSKHAYPDRFIYLFHGKSRTWTSILQTAVVIRQVLFLLFVFLGISWVISSSQNMSDFPPFSPALPKQLSKRNLKCRQSLSVLVPFPGDYWRNFTRYRKHHPNLVNATWLWRITRGISSNKKRRDIWTENKQGHLTSCTNGIFFRASEG